MSFKTKIKLIYLFGELEGDFKRLQKKEWLNQSDLQLVLKEYEDIKEKYLQIYDNHNEEIAIQLIYRMKEMPIDTFLKNKNKFLLRFEEWKKIKKAN